MHICYLCDEYPPERVGGVGAFVQTLARALVARGHDVAVVGCHDGARDCDEVDEGVRVLRLSRTGWPRMGTWLNGRRITRALREIHARRPVDVVETPGSGLALVPASFPAAKVIRMHGGHRFFAEAVGRRPRPWGAFVERRSTPRADFFCAVSRYVAEENRRLLGLGETPIEVIPNPVDVSRFAPRPDAAQVPGRILCLSTLSLKKGVREIVAAIPAVLDADSRAHLHMVGRDWRDPQTGASLREALEALVPARLRDRVRFLGEVAHPEVPSVLAEAQVVVFPSLMEAMPVAWIEAMASAKAIVASRLGPGPEVLTDGVEGLLCDPRDPVALAGAIRRCLEDAGLRRRLAQAARLRAERCYSIDRLVEVNEAFYARCVAKHRSAGRGPRRRGGGRGGGRGPGRRALGAPPPLRLTGMRVVVVSSKPCVASPTSPSGYATDGGFPLQMRALSELFGSTRLLVPCGAGPGKDGLTALTGRALSVVPIVEPAGRGLARKAGLIPWSLATGGVLLREMRRADAVHAVIPGDVGAIGMVMAFLTRRRLFVRHCGNWERRVTAGDRFARWFLEHAAGGRTVALATGAGESPPTAANTHVGWILATTQSREDRERVGGRRESVDLGAPLVVTVGRLEASKGTDLLIEALPLLRARWPGARLEVLGDGPARAALREKAEALGIDDAVAFSGQLPHAAVLARLRDAAVFCLASVSEGFPKAVVEAMASGVPVVVTDLPVLRHLLSSGGGVLLESRTPEAIAKASASCVEDPARYRRLSDQARTAARPFTLERWRDEIGARLSAAWCPWPPARRGTACTPPGAVA